MSRRFACVALAGIASVISTAWAQQPESQPPTPPPAPAPIPAPPPPPKAIPVPEGPVVNKQELAGGLIVEDIIIGSGPEVKPGVAVLAHYHGTLKADGTVFQSSFETGEPVVFSLNGVIQGWAQGLPGMKVGGVRRLTIPAAMAYGERSPTEKIPPNSDLVFVIQLEESMWIEDLQEGTGPAATGPCVAVTTHTCKTEDGAEVAKADASNPYVWIPGEMNPPGTQFDTMQLAFEGMKVGGKRRVHIPARMNVSPPQLETDRPRDVPLTIEFELVGVRNLPQPQQQPRRPGGR
ncbi:MAG: hypothetical protein AMXMBFR58_04980 [Phycisphaerae bacterium]|nr:hypothetical protein [Phycisphaerales bacterium]